MKLTEEQETKLAEIEATLDSMGLGYFIAIAPYSDHGFDGIVCSNIKLRVVPKQLRALADQLEKQHQEGAN